MTRRELVSIVIGLLVMCVFVGALFASANWVYGKKIEKCLELFPTHSYEQCKWQTAPDWR